MVEEKEKVKKAEEKHEKTEGDKNNLIKSIIYYIKNTIYY